MLNGTLSLNAFFEFTSTHFIVLLCLIPPLKILRTFLSVFLASRCDRSLEHLRRKIPLHLHTCRSHLYVRNQLSATHMKVFFADNGVYGLVTILNIPITASYLFSILSPFSFNVTTFKAQCFTNSLSFCTCYLVSVSCIISYVSVYSF